MVGTMVEDWPLTDCSGILGPGVYVLRNRGVTVFVGSAKASILAWVHGHRTNTAREWNTFSMIARPVPFDEVLVFACAKGEIDSTLTRITIEYPIGTEFTQATTPFLRRA